jgi:hypothetical protein
VRGLYLSILSNTSSVEQCLAVGMMRLGRACVLAVIYTIILATLYLIVARVFSQRVSSLYSLKRHSLLPAFSRWLWAPW